MFDFRIFPVMLVHMCVIMCSISAILDCQFVFERQKISRVLVCSLIFYYLKNWIKETVLSFVYKMKLNVQGYLKCWLSRLERLLWAEHKFNCGIAGLRKVGLVARARQQLMKTLRQWRKGFWIIVESLSQRGCWWCWHIVLIMPCNFYRCFRHEKCGNEDCSKIK